MNYLIVVDMQNDFIDGALGTAEAQKIVPYVKSLVENFDGTVLFTKDTHTENYLSSAEGKRLPIPHCIKGTTGWELHPELEALKKTEVIEKPTFGSVALLELLRNNGDASSITFVGLCTDICVISNVLLAKAYFPEIPISVNARGCAGVTTDSHNNALAAMRACQIDIIGE